MLDLRARTLEVSLQKSAARQITILNSYATEPIGLAGMSTLPTARSVVIDAHHHLWRYSAAEYEWIDDTMVSIRRDFRKLPHQRWV